MASKRLRHQNVVRFGQIRMVEVRSAAFRRVYASAEPRQRPVRAGNVPAAGPIGTVHDEFARLMGRLKSYGQFVR